VTLGPVPASWRPGPAVAAVILVGEDGYLLQARDSRAGIWYPGHWGLFGGAVEPGESHESALRRELLEELCFDLSTPRYFLDMAFNFNFAAEQLARSVFEVEMPEATLPKLELREGRGMRIFRRAEIDAKVPIVPCDRFVLDIHISRR
jgi:8-oxo-dGTP pyrophosphatase MutT (NUDIX family)